MISNEERWHYLAVKKLSALLSGVTSKQDDDFSLLNYLYLFRAKKTVKSLREVCENKDFCSVLILSEDIKVLEFHIYEKFDKTTSIIYADVESLIK